MIMRQRWWMLVSIFVAAVSFLFIYYLVNYTWPVPDMILARPQLLFLVFVFLGLGATTLPVVAYLNHRFAKANWYERDKTRLLRQAAWVGFFGVLLAYLQLIRALNWTMAIVLAGVFVLIEAFFLTRE